ncbi:hypothetical protein [Stenotrophomonas sp. MMGLT7]|uniref:hypothetical protein n=1 Tax=Stenotrophomonas sp. MMGLT7 TaxID=2901227 RepID=UPI001E3B4407|nr:hypothetical protein [Stenotrophomonas sp. MMGLT7]MCD7097794.1 hypothetical protein [Stenotrophomonas sp. MMGLT7]
MSVNLHIGAEDTRFSAPQIPGAAVTVPLGLHRLGGELAGFPPRESALEHAIACVEDALMPHVARIRQLGASSLASGDAACQAIAEAAGALPDRPVVIDIDAVERVFERLARVAAGRPARWEGLPEDQDFAAALVLLREIMHHAGFFSLRVEAR